MLCFADGGQELEDADEQEGESFFFNRGILFAREHGENYRNGNCSVKPLGIVFHFVPDAIIVSCGETKFEVEMERDGTVRASSIESMLPPRLFAKGIESAGGLTIKPTRGKFLPPNNRWDSEVYTVLAGEVYILLYGPVTPLRMRET